MAILILFGALATIGVLSIFDIESDAQAYEVRQRRNRRALRRELRRMRGDS